MKLATLDGIIEIPDEVKENKPSTINPFDYVKAINANHDIMEDEVSEKQYNPYIVNKAMSFGMDTVIQANEMNSRPHLDKRLQFSFFINSIRPRKRFNPWLKAEKIQDLDAIKQYYQYSTDKALHVLNILTPRQIDVIKERLYTGGVKNERQSHSD
jgi:hypothetical protein